MSKKTKQGWVNERLYLVDCYGQQAMAWTLKGARKEAAHLAEMNGGARVLIDVFDFNRRIVKPGRTLP